jgi:hypothetical protein
MDAGSGSRRLFFRIETQIGAKIRCNAHYADCTVLDLSEGGARVKSLSAVVPPREMALEIPGIGCLAGRVVWRRKGQFGIQFHRTGTVRTGGISPDASPDAPNGSRNHGGAYSRRAPEDISQPDVITDAVALRGEKLQKLRRLAAFNGK